MVQKHGVQQLTQEVVQLVSPVLPVTQSGRGNVTAAASEKATLPLEMSSLVILFRTVDNLVTKMQRPAA